MKGYIIILALLSIILYFGMNNTFIKRKVEKYSTVLGPDSFRNSTTYGYYDYYDLWDVLKPEIYDHRWFGGFDGDVKYLHKKRSYYPYEPWQ